MGAAQPKENQNLKQRDQSKVEGNGLKNTYY